MEDGIDNYCSVCAKDEALCKCESASESALNDLLTEASRHYAEMAPHVKRRKTAQLLMQLVEQNIELQKSVDRMRGLESALQVIAGEKQGLDNLMSNVSIAKAALRS